MPMPMPNSLAAFVVAAAFAGYRVTGFGFGPLFNTAAPLTLILSPSKLFRRRRKEGEIVGQWHPPPRLPP